MSIKTKLLGLATAFALVGAAFSADAGIKISDGGASLSVSGASIYGGTITTTGVPSGATCQWVHAPSTPISGATSCASYTTVFGDVGSTVDIVVTVNGIPVTNVITLSALSLTPLSANVGVTYTGTLSGNTSGSTISLSNSVGGKYSLSWPTLTGTGLTLGTDAPQLTETLTGATNTPKVTNFSISVLPNYVPFAVHFDNHLTFLDTNGTAPATAGGTLTNVHQFTQSFWLRPRQCAPPTSGWGNNRSDTTCYANLFGVIMQSPDNSENVPGHNWVWDFASSTTFGTLRNGVGDTSENNAAGISHACNNTYIPAEMADSNWHHYWYSGNFNATIGTTEYSVLYKDGVLIASGCDYPPGGPLGVAMQSRGWQMHYSPFAATNPLNDLPATFDIADFIEDDVTPAVCLSTSNMTIGGVSYSCSAAGALPVNISTGQSIVAGFYNGGPVDPGSTCNLTPFNRTPEFCFHDTSKTTWGTNKGLVNNATNVGGIFAAPTNPVSAATRPYINWSTSNSCTVFSSYCTASVGTFFANKNVVLPNDFLFLKITVDDGGTVDHNPLCPTTGTWAQIQRTTPSSNVNVSSVTCWARGSTSGMDANGVNTYAWTTGTSFARQAQWLLWDVTGTASTSSLDGTPTYATVGVGGPGVTFVTPTITTTGTTDTLLSVFGTWYYPITTPPASMDMLAGVGDGPGDITVGQEYLSAACTASCSRTGTISTSSYGGDVLTIAIKP